MNKTSIEWVKNPDGTQGYTFNPITGCLNNTPEGLCLGGGFPCYAFKLANGRLKSLYLANLNIPDLIDWNGHPYDKPGVREKLLTPFYPRFWEDRLWDKDIVGRYSHFGVNRDHLVTAKGIFVCDMSDLFGIGIPERWTFKILQVIKDNKFHRFYLLTKQPQNLIKWSPFPVNCWVGVTATDSKMAWNAYADLAAIHASIKFMSLEPLLGQIDTRMIDSFKGIISWVIIGACTGKKNEIMELCQRNPDLTPMPYGKIWTAQPKIEWVEEIVRACDKAGIPVFLKDNLKPLFAETVTIGDKWVWAKDRGYGGLYRQEMP